MLTRLQHHALIRRNHEQSQIDSARSNEHAANEVLVTGDVDDADRSNTLQLQGSEAEVYGDASAFLFGKAVGVDACQSLDQRSLSVIDVPSGPNDHAALHRSCSHTANA